MCSICKSGKNKLRFEDMSLTEMGKKFIPNEGDIQEFLEEHFGFKYHESSYGQWWLSYNGITVTTIMNLDESHEILSGMFLMISLINRELFPLQVDSICFMIRSDLQAYVDNEVSEEISKTIQNHISTCGPCKLQLGQRKYLTDLLKKTTISDTPNL